MKPIPVIDLLGGYAVKASQGLRSQYPVLSSPLCPSGDPVSLAHRLVHEYHCDTLYIADLDAIQGTGNHDDLLQILTEQLPQISLWLDAGINNAQRLEYIAHLPGVRAVIGSETLSDTGLLHHHAAQNAVLSLDYHLSGYAGPKDLLSSPSLWPRDVILMSLPHVGKAEGPDLSDLRQRIQQSPQTRFYSAGGVRHRDDLLAVKAAGASGVLLASALHNGTVGAEDLQGL